MPRFIEVVHIQWIGAPEATVRAQFADLDHHIRANVHPKLRFEVLQRRPLGARFMQEVKLLGLRQRDVFERSILANGSILDESVEGFNKGGSLRFDFAPQGAGTSVTITIKLPLPPVIGPLIKPLLEAQVRKEVRAAALEDQVDIERRGYPSGALAAAAVAAR